jgi:hypothetical protein
VNEVSGDPTRQTLYWQQPTQSRVPYPTLRLDYNITAKHRFTASITQNHNWSSPDTTNIRQKRFPGFTMQGLQDSYRWTSQLSLRSVLTRNMVNELRVGGTGGATQFSPDPADMFAGTPDMTLNGTTYGIALTNYRSIDNPYSSTTPSAREGSTRLVEDTLSWLKGKHSLGMGASFTRADVWLWNKQVVPTITFGMVAGDPADTMFSSANFPGSSSTQRDYARALYALLTGRVLGIGREARIGEDGTTYTVLGESRQQGRVWQIGAFLQDAWRWKPNLTINAGLRYELGLPFYALNNSYSEATIDDVLGITGTGSGFVPGSNVTGLGNLFQPGKLEGQPTSYTLLEKGKSAYNTDWNNVAPSIGVAWTTGADQGFWHTVLGAQGDSVIRAGYSISYQRNGTADYTGVYGGNPGLSIDASRNIARGNLGPLPVLLRSSDLGAPDIPLTRVYPMAVPRARARASTPLIRTSSCRGRPRARSGSSARSRRTWRWKSGTCTRTAMTGGSAATSAGGTTTRSWSWRTGT